MAESERVQKQIEKIDKKIEIIESRPHSVLMYETYYDWKIRKLSMKKCALLKSQNKEDVMER